MSESDPAVHRMDYPSLDLGYSAASERDVSIVGLDLKVYGLDEIASSTLPIVVVVAMHGRTNSLKNMVSFANGLIGETTHLEKTSGKTKAKDLLVVTLDQRNHGARLKDKKANLAYDENPNHLLDMTATVYGAEQDFTMISNFLASYLFPSGERVIDQFIPTGISLGGNATWRILLTNPRVTIGVPIIGLPFTSFSKYLGARAISQGFEFKPPIYPPSLIPLLDPCPRPSPTVYAGKKILSLHGAVDALVPYSQGKEDLDGIVEASQNGEIEVWVQENRGHVCTPEMTKRAAEWIWRWGMSA